MPDVFLSYSREDQPTARRFAEALKREGFNVWWDQALNPGEAFDQVTEKALNEARAVVVLWSKKSVDSRWVRAEATQAQSDGRLVPVTIEACKRPIMFELTHTVDLSRWNGDTADDQWRSLVDGLHRQIGGPGATAPEAVSPSAARASRKWIGWVAAAALGAIILGVGLHLARRDHPAPDEIKRLAVLPFTNLSSDPAYGFFADGLHEELLTAISQQAPELELVSRTTMMTYRGSAKTIEAIAKELGATHVLEASVRRDPDQVRLTVQLIDARKDRHVWSQSYDRTAQQSLGLQSEVAREVAQQLAARLTAAKPTAPPTRDPEAYDLYLKAKGMMAGRGLLTPVDFAQIMALLDGAIARDPAFVAAYLQRVRARLIVFDQGLDHSRAIVDATRADIDRARTFAPAEPEIHAAEAFYAGEVERDMARGLRELDAARDAGLREVTWEHLRSFILAGLGRKEEVLALCRHLVDLDPVNLLALDLCVGRAAMVRQPKESLRYAGLALARDPAYRLMDLRRAFVIADYTGNIDPLGKLLDATGADIATLFPAAGDLKNVHLYLTGRYKEILAQPAPATSNTNWLGAGQALSLRAWSALLLDDRKRAAAEGRELLALVNRQEQLPWDQWDLLRLESTGRVATGECKQALEASQRALSLLPRERLGFWWVQVASQRASVAAWCGHQEEAVQLLEELAISIPGLAPASIAREPVFLTSLAANARFQALRARLEQQMRDTKLE